MTDLDDHKKNKILILKVRTIERMLLENNDPDIVESLELLLNETNNQLRG